MVGQVVDGHELVRHVATGGMGEVYLGRHLRLGVPRAIKVIRDDQRADRIAAERFVREARVLSSLQHNAIVQIVEFGELSNSWPFLVMEYVDGPNLDQCVDARGPFALGDALVVLEQIASALAYAHKKRVVHRDLKPANVLLRAGDLRQVKVIDFGIAYMLSAATISRLTAEGQMLGSPLYMAPEQANGSLDVTPAVDSYALAGIAYRLLSGSPVFPGRKLIGLIVAHAAETPERLSVRCPQIPRLLDDLIYACLAKQPEARPPLDELANSLAHLARAARQGTDDPATEGEVDNVSRAARGELVELVSAPPPRDDVSEPLINQLIALVGEIAATLAPEEPALAGLLDTAHRATSDLTDIEMELAVLDARAEELPSTGRSSVDPRRAHLVDRASSLKSQVAETQSRLAGNVDRMRSIGGVKTRHLFVALDTVMSKLRSRAR
jgi:serine/threonine protein kinase